MKFWGATLTREGNFVASLVVSFVEFPPVVVEVLPVA